MTSKKPTKANGQKKLVSTTPLRKLRVMLSSRNNDLIPDDNGVAKLSEVRLELQNQLQAEKFLGRGLLDVWINEEAGAEAGGTTAWNLCLGEVDDADVLIVIYNGQAGWSKDPGGLGICHAEMAHAWHKTSGKVFLIQMTFESDKGRKLQSPEEVARANSQNRAFAEFLDRTSSFKAFAGDRQALKDQVKLAILNAITKYLELGRRGMHVGEISPGPALDWSRMTYDQRKSAIEKGGNDYFIARGALKEGTDLVWTWGGQKILLRVHGVPASFGIAEARERVGRPYLEDHTILGRKGMNEVVGPLHVILCHKNITESQVISFMGHPDLFIVRAANGFFVADRISFVQALFLMNAIDDDAIRVSLQGIFEWIESQAQEMGNIVARAHSRAAILRTMAGEIARHR
jgi:Domain of unknown function (DUF4062)